MNCKYLLFPFLFLITSLQGFSQKEYHKFQLGLAAGMNQTLITKETGIATMSDHKGYKKPLFSLVSLIPLSERLSLQPEFVLMQKRYTYDVAVDAAATGQPQIWPDFFSEKYLQIPVLLNYRLVNKPAISVIAGGSAAFRIKKDQIPFFIRNNKAENAYELSLIGGIQIRQPITPWLSVYAQSQYEALVYRNDVHKLNAVNAKLGVLFRLPDKNSAPRATSISTDTTSNKSAKNSQNKSPQLGVSGGVLRSFPDSKSINSFSLHTSGGLTSYAISINYAFARKDRSGFQTGISILQKGFTGENKLSFGFDNDEAFKHTWLQVPLIINHQLFERINLSVLGGISAGILIIEDNSMSLYSPDFIYEISAHGGLQYIKSVGNNFNILARAEYQLPFIHADHIFNHALIGSIGFMYDL